MLTSMVSIIYLFIYSFIHFEKVAPRKYISSQHQTLIVVMLN